MAAISGNVESVQRAISQRLQQWGEADGVLQNAAQKTVSQWDRGLFVAERPDGTVSSQPKKVSPFLIEGLDGIPPSVAPDSSFGLARASLAGITGSLQHLRLPSRF